MSIYRFTKRADMYSAGYTSLPHRHGRSHWCGDPPRWHIKTLRFKHRHSTAGHRYNGL